MRVAYAVQASLAISVVVAAPYNPQHVVLGINGQVVVDADPSLFFRRSRSQLRPRPQQLEVEQPPSRRLGFGFDLQAASRVSPECEAKALPAIVLPTVHDALLAVQGMEASVQETEEDEFSTNTELSNAALAWSRVAVVDENDVPGVYGSVVFAELSCCFVAFIGYLVHSIPLWTSFSRGQKCCLIVAFGSAALYQFAAFGWYVEVVSPELMLGLSSLITRMISLGMVPITTTSFMARAREICQDPTVSTSRSTGSHSSRSSRRHHARARCS